ncbi:probable WRKY transcription factor 20 isoform X2 [Olea europaea var. sylvestris]|uniref:Probable WRKY transcription factor 20 isoform X1 n=1 Tax=Olea europaea subsp. europaea TaxID=158383 RepID=A0A8S0PY41_OLEEU|nr:probable WRKY transcription factor 20 isoform X2 [Olea europaea var. sylvestris]CAA2956461.1 probable WRKY transcription factor 20 isoform X1 [Olea europaea subsp. europaea]
MDEDTQSLAPSPSNNASTRVPDTGAAARVEAVFSGGSSNGAKYKLMSPAKLPISRSTCITVPPGLSPTSFLESPVLLSNIKAEPSPTTGSFLKPHLMQGYGETSALPLRKKCPGGNSSDERMPSIFEFNFHAGSSRASRLSSKGLMIPSSLNRPQNGPFSQVEDHCFSQPPAPSSLATCELPSSKVFGPSILTGTHGASSGGTVEELNQGDCSNTDIQVSPSDHKDGVPVTAERTSDDGYNWRKYGQKLVKGSEFPRSYYKCTYPGCEVKKIFERSPSGQITEIVYKGSHDHQKPVPARRQNPGAFMSVHEDKMDKDVTGTGQEVPSPHQVNEDGLKGADSQFHSTNDYIDEDDPFSKRRKMEDGLDITTVVKPIREPRVVVQTMSEVDILDDGYRWRKYGQKVVRGNPNPRSYYKCTTASCPVRKHVERASHDPKAVITTYEGKHNHDVPTAKTSSYEFSGHSQVSGTSRPRPVDNSSIGLNLGVGINCENRTNVQIPACYGIVNGGGLNLFGNRENGVEAHNFQTQPIHPSNQCPQNIGRVVMGP